MISKVKHKLTHYLDVLYNKYYPMQIVFRNRQRKRLLNKKFSLLTGNCIGGYIYHQLGLGFTSPTINMMILNQDFKKLLLNLNHYMSLTPEPYQDKRFPGVPSAKLDDIILHFTHYDTVQEGIDAWEKRKLRVDYDNLYIIISDIDLSKSDIEELSKVKCKKIVVLTSKDYGFDHCLFIPAFNGRKTCRRIAGENFIG